MRLSKGKQVKEWTERDLDQYVDLWFDGFASETDFDTMSKIASGKVPSSVLEDCLDSLANTYGIGAYKVDLYKHDIRNRIVELAEDDLDKWEDLDDEDDEIDESRNPQCKKIKKVTEGWVSDESHSLWYSLANSLAHDLNCDVWINDIGWMELSKDEEQLIQIYVRWNGGRGELIVNKDAKEQKIGQCGTDKLPEASHIANRLVSMGLWEL